MEMIAEKLRQEIPFQYTIYEAPDGAYGTINDREEWNGMIGELVSAVGYSDMVEFLGNHLW